jgi:hypothetical protein
MQSYIRTGKQSLSNESMNIKSRMNHMNSMSMKSKNSGWRLNSSESDLSELPP